MKILAIETSCDETAICYLEINNTEKGLESTIHNNITHTQLEHIAYGGVFPAVAKREHQINLPIILDKIMHNQDIPDVICVTNGPGLEPALWCGITFAQELGVKWNIPVVPVNHMEGHILSILSPSLNSIENLTFTIPHQTFLLPAIALLISGGHTELVLVKDIGDYEIIGKTRDDAVGEAFDKVARILGLPYPGGPEISKLAENFNGNNPVELPRPMLHSKDYDFSFSGLKTAVLYLVNDVKKDNNDIIPESTKSAIAHEFQVSAGEVLLKKSLTAVKDFGTQSFIVAGGVSANTHIKQVLREKISDYIDIDNIYFPDNGLTGDNALMIAIAGYFKIQKNPDVIYNDIKAVGNLSF